MSLREGRAAETTCGLATTVVSAGAVASTAVTESAWFTTDVASVKPATRAMCTAMSADETWSSGPAATSEASGPITLLWCGACLLVVDLATKKITTNKSTRLALSKL